MRILEKGIFDPNEDSGLELIKFRIIGKRYSQWRALIAQLGESDTAFLLALKELHGIIIDKAADPVLYLTQDTQQMRLLAEDGEQFTGMLAVLLTSKCFSLSEADCQARMERLLRGTEATGASAS